ncbi:MAG: hypothetical protein ACEY26_00605 [Candidatus Hodgkinia cicadicola]
MISNVFLSTFTKWTFVLHQFNFVSLLSTASNLYNNVLTDVSLRFPIGWKHLLTLICLVANIMLCF